MTLVPRSLARTAALALAAALALSACSTSEPADPPTSASSSTTGTTGPSPSESTPAPGEWTLDDLKVGAQVPKEDLERLFPAWEKPTPPATLTEESEQGAKDAAVYFAAVVDYAAAIHDDGPINAIDTGYCANCSSLREAVKSPQAKRVLRSKAEYAATSYTEDPDNPHVIEVLVRSSAPPNLEMDASGLKVVDKSTERSFDLYYYVSFIDNQWAPYFLNMEDSQL